MHGGDIYRQRVDLDYSVCLNPLGMPPEAVSACMRLLAEEQHYPDIRISEDPRIMDSYTLIRSFEDGHIGLVPPHVGKQFLPLTTVPLKMDMSWPVGFVYREPRSVVLNQFIEVAKQVFRQA